MSAWAPRTIPACCARSARSPRSRRGSSARTGPSRRPSRWCRTCAGGRSYESYSENPDIVRAYAGAMVEGIQGVPGTPDFLRDGYIVATIKHFLGDGAPTRVATRATISPARKTCATSIRPAISPASRPAPRR
ncbi:MAG: glycoside hydrolase family 3 N-terminal domain-containing protein [Rhizomicrobium sp.]